MQHLPCLPKAPALCKSLLAESLCQTRDYVSPGHGPAHNADTPDPQVSPPSAWHTHKEPHKACLSAQAEGARLATPWHTPARSAAVSSHHERRGFQCGQEMPAPPQEEADLPWGQEVPVQAPQIPRGRESPSSLNAATHRDPNPTRTQVRKEQSPNPHRSCTGLALVSAGPPPRHTDGPHGREGVPKSRLREQVIGTVAQQAPPHQRPLF